MVSSTGVDINWNLSQNYHWIGLSLEHHWFDWLIVIIFKGLSPDDHLSELVEAKI